MAEAGAPTPDQARAWADRRRGEADNAGLTAARARQGIVQALATNNPSMVRAASIAYGVLIDKALLISDGLDAEVDDSSPGEEDPVDAIAARRAARRAAAAG